MSIFSFLSNLFNSLFNATKNAWNHLPTSVQTGILNGSGIFSILNQYTGQDPKLTIATIQANFPAENLDLLYSGLSEVAKTWGLTIPATLEDLVVVLQNYLKQVESSKWDSIISTGAQILANVLTGSSTPFEIIVTVIQWVYTNLVKDKTIAVVSVPASTVAI